MSLSMRQGYLGGNWFRRLSITRCQHLRSRSPESHFRWVVFSVAFVLFLLLCDRVSSAQNTNERKDGEEQKQEVPTAPEPGTHL